MSKLENDIRRALAQEETLTDLEREEGVFRQMAGIFRGKTRWMAVLAIVEVLVVLALIVVAAIEFFKAEDTKWQIFYATCVLLLAMMILLVKLWGWMQMNRNAIQREIKRLELRLLEIGRRG